MRFGAAFVPVCMVVIAASFGATAYLTLSISAIEATAVGVTALSALAAYATFSGRAQERAETQRQVAELSRGVTELARQVGELGRRVVAAETAVAQAAEQPGKQAPAYGDELVVLGTLVNQLAETVAAHEAALKSPAFVPAAAPVAPAPPAVSAAAPVVAARPAPTPPAYDAEPLDMAEIGETFGAPPVARTESTDAIQAAIEDNRVDLYLQPIVTLPQRKTRHYEALARLRDEDGAVVGGPENFGGATPALDRVMLLRALQVVRRMTAKNPEASLIYTVSAEAMTDPDFAADLSDFVAANRAHASALVLGVTQEALRSMRSIERSAMARIAGLGVRFALDRIDDPVLDGKELAARGFRFVKAPASLLLDRSGETAGPIHMADFASLLSRFGIGLIADRVETEGTVVDLLEYDIALAQGDLFSPPRPVRAEVFQTPPARPPQTEAPPVPAPRRRDTEDAAPARSTPERNAQGLAKIARTVMRRA